MKTACPQCGKGHHLLKTDYVWRYCSKRCREVGESIPCKPAKAPIVANVPKGNQP